MGGKMRPATPPMNVNDPASFTANQNAGLDNYRAMQPFQRDGGDDFANGNGQIRQALAARDKYQAQQAEQARINDAVKQQLAAQQAAMAQQPAVQPAVQQNYQDLANASREAAQLGAQRGSLAGASRQAAQMAAALPVQGAAPQLPPAMSAADQRAQMQQAFQNMTAQRAAAVPAVQPALPAAPPPTRVLPAVPVQGATRAVAPAPRVPTQQGIAKQALSTPVRGPAPTATPPVQPPPMASAVMPPPPPMASAVMPDNTAGAKAGAFRPAPAAAQRQQFSQAFNAPRDF